MKKIKQEDLSLEVKEVTSLEGPSMTIDTQITCLTCHLCDSKDTCTLYTKEEVNCNFSEEIETCNATNMTQCICNTNDCEPTNNACDTFSGAQICCDLDTEDQCPVRTNYCASDDYCPATNDCASQNTDCHPITIGGDCETENFLCNPTGGSY